MSLLQNFSSAHLHLDPYPHVVIDSALPQRLCDELRATYPSLESQGVDSQMDNVRWSTKARACPNIENIAPVWTEIISYHSSQAFLNEVLTVFSDHLIKLYPHRFPDHAALHDQKAVVRDIDNPGHGVLSLDAQISGNTPARTPSAPRGVHLDSPNALYGGLYYLRDNNDDSIGGDLQVWKWKSNYSFRRKSSEYKEDVPLRHVEYVKTIPYKANTFVLFINTIDSLHSVTVRQPTPHTRKFINLLADSDQNFFTLNPLPHLRVRNSIRRRLTD